MIGLHLISWNRPKMTELVIKTIHRNTTPGTFHLSIVDNGSDKETIDMLERLGGEGYINNVYYLKENKGLEYARQMLFLDDSKADLNLEFFVDIDNDCLPQPIVIGSADWLEQLVQLMQKYEDYAAISCRTQAMVGTGNIFEDDLKDITPFPHPGGSYRIMRTRDVKRVGGWDRESSGRGSEETYICGKLRDAGYKTGFATHVRSLHLFGTRAKGQETDRWGYPQDWTPEQSGHSDIWHPVFGTGDEPTEIYKYSGKELTRKYFGVNRSN